MGTEISIIDLVRMNEEDVQKAFSEAGGSITVLPEKCYVIDWDAIQNFDELKALMQAVTSLIIPRTITMGELEFSKSALKPYLKEVTTSSVPPDPS